jgi:hypothetical protein
MLVGRAITANDSTFALLGSDAADEILPPGTAAWLHTKDKYNLPMFSDVCQAETKAQ